MIRNESNICTSSERDYVYALKIFAIFSVVCAHVVTVPQGTNPYNFTFSWILGNLGSIGIAIFYLISGYLFAKNQKGISQFFKRKVKTIIFPWFVTGSTVFIILKATKHQLSFWNWFNFIIGNGSPLYFLTILIMLYAIYFFIKDNQKLLITTILISAISIILTANHVFDGINAYLNPFNFMIYFAVGIIISKTDSLFTIAKFSGKYLYVISSIYIIFLIIIKKFNISSGYFGHATLFIVPIEVLLVFGLATLKTYYSNTMLNYGKESFSIYLLHIPVVAVTVKLLNHFNLWELTMLRPFLVLYITITFVRLYKYLTSKFKISHMLNLSIGLER